MIFFLFFSLIIYDFQLIFRSTNDLFSLIAMRYIFLVTTNIAAFNHFDQGV